MCNAPVLYLYVRIGTCAYCHILYGTTHDFKRRKSAQLSSRLLRFDHEGAECTKRRGDSASAFPFSPDADSRRCSCCCSGTRLARVLQANQLVRRIICLHSIRDHQFEPYTGEGLFFTSVIRSAGYNLYVLDTGQQRHTCGYVLSVNGL